MLHFPSKNTAAHTADRAEVTRLHQLLGDHVWAFSNCRADAPPLPVAEVDWLFYNSLKGTFILSEWKRFPAGVQRVSDVGEPWVLAGGTTVGNPVEQVARQLDAVRRVLRLTVAPLHFPALDPHDINPYQSVYSPQIGPGTEVERLRFGAVHGSLEGLVETIERRYTPTPLILSSQPEQLVLAGTLADLFRCSVPAAVRRKLDPPAAVPAAPSPRIAAIHRELAALHLELASLLDPQPVVAAPAPISASTLVPAPLLSQGNDVPSSLIAKATKSAPPAPAIKAAKTSASGHLKGHVTRLVPASKPTSDNLRNAFLAALQDGQLKSSGVHIGLFGSFVGQHLTGEVKLTDLAPGGLTKWCHAQAEAAGIRIVKDAREPSVVRTVRPTNSQKEAV
ncbi:hypothetical protein [Arthrobacter sp. Ld5]|uniref:hypothetical protein n=1 Tax=Arthrobacter sp. Ld5 TaxID=649152 RepID=UPI003EBEB585